MAKTFANLADRMLARLAPQATASASNGWYEACKCMLDGSKLYWYCIAVAGVGTKCGPCNIRR